MSMPNPSMELYNPYIVDRYTVEKNIGHLKEDWVGLSTFRTEEEARVHLSHYKQVKEFGVKDRIIEL